MLFTDRSEGREYTGSRGRWRYKCYCTDRSEGREYTGSRGRWRFNYVKMINVIVQTGVRVESILELEEDEEDTSSSVRSQGNTFILLQWEPETWELEEDITTIIKCIWCCHKENSFMYFLVA